MATSWHLEPEEIASLVDGTATAVARERIEAHLAGCVECRRELLQVDQVARSAPRRSTPWLVPLAATAATAAALLLIVVPSHNRNGEPNAPLHREPAVSATAAPVTLSPRGDVEEVDTLRWSRVPGADRYGVAIYDAEGVLVWEAAAMDTAAGLPGSVNLGPGRIYFWSVRAHTGYERWSESGLTRFHVAAGDTTP